MTAFSTAVEQEVAPHVASPHDQSEPLAEALRGLKEESGPRIIIEELNTGRNGEVAVLHGEVNALRRELQQAKDHTTQRMLDMDNMFKYEARNAENTRDIATALKSMGTGLHRFLMALPVKEGKSQVDNEPLPDSDSEEETSAANSGCSDHHLGPSIDLHLCCYSCRDPAEEVWCCSHHQLGSGGRQEEEEASRDGNTECVPRCDRPLQSKDKQLCTVCQQ
jgi:hypothetical protein